MEITEFTGLEPEDEGEFPVKSSDCQVLDQMKNVKNRNWVGERMVSLQAMFFPAGMT